MKKDYGKILACIPACVLKHKHMNCPQRDVCGLVFCPITICPWQIYTTETFDGIVGQLSLTRFYEFLKDLSL